MSIHRKLMTVCCGAVLAFGLAACGTSGDDSTAGAPAVERPTGPTQADLVDAEKKRADAAEKLLADKAKADAQDKSEGLFAAIKLNVEGLPTDEMHPDSDPDNGVAALAAKAMPPVADSRDKDDKDAATIVAFAKHYMGMDPMSRITENTVDTVTMLTTGPEPGAASDKFPENGGSHVYTAEADDAVSLPGTLMGASGTYDCSGATCRISEDGGKYTFVGGWTFDADPGAMVTIKDDDYSRWGWWAFKRKDDTFRVETFTDYSKDADDITESTDLADLANLGTATYMGSAAGKYAIDNRPTGKTLEAAHFDADATIKANFGELVTSTVTGTIDNFMVDGEARDWSVALGMTPVRWGDAAAVDGPVRDFDSSADDTEGNNAGATSVWTIGGVKGDADGDWSGDFHHDGDAREDGTPATVIGQFTASHGTSAYMTGAFGASNMAEDTPR